MRNKVILVLTILLIIGFWTTFYFLDKQEKKDRKDEVLAIYSNVAYIFRLDLDESLFMKTGDENDFYLNATDKTWEVMIRWEKLAEVFPDIHYPEDEIKQEQWITVREVYFENTTEIENAAIELAEGSPQDDYPGVYSLDEYILRGNISTPYLKEQLELRGIKE